jgi:integrase
MVKKCGGLYIEHNSQFLSGFRARHLGAHQSMRANLFRPFKFDFEATSRFARPAKAEAADNGKGRSAKHQTSELSFHSFRHTLTTWLKSSGASNALAQMIMAMTAKWFHAATPTSKWRP